MISSACGSQEPATALEAFRLAWKVNPKQALSQVATTWQGLAFALKWGRKEGPLGVRTKTPPPPVHHKRPGLSSQAAPLLGSYPQFLHPRTWLAPQFGRQLSMNERSSLAFPAHLLVKQPPGQPHTPTTLPTPLLGVFSFLSHAPPSVGSPYPPPYNQATCSFCTGREEAGLSHCFCQECSTKLHSAHWPPAGKPTEENLGLHLCIQ